MRRILIFLLTAIVLTGCNYDYENQKKIDSVSPDAYIKQVADEFFSVDKLDTMPFQASNATLAYLQTTYASYPSAETGSVGMADLLKHFKSLVGGDISALTYIVTGFSNATGVYQADVQAKKWVKQSAANDSIVLNFKDQYGQDRQTLMSWSNSTGKPIRITFVRAGGSATVDLPDRLTLKLRNLSSANDSVMTVDVAVDFNQSFTKVTFSNTLSYLDYVSDVTTEVTDNTLDIAAKLTRNNEFLGSYVLQGTGSNLIKGAINKVDYQLELGAYTSSMNILNKLTTTNDVSNMETLRKYLLSTEASSSYDYIKGVCDIINSVTTFKVWNASGSLLCSSTMYPVKLNGEYVGAPYINWIYGDSQDLSDFGNSGVKSVVSELQSLLKKLNSLLKSD